MVPLCCRTNVPVRPSSVPVALHRDVAGGALYLGHRADHLALAGRCEVAVKLFVERHAAKSRSLGFFVVWFLRGSFYVERSCGVFGH
jgi:hypothetical protein